MTAAENVILNIRHITYATANYSQAAQLLSKSARRYGIDDFRVYSPSDSPIRHLHGNYPVIMSNPRGAGFWLWKPFVILDALNSVPDGSLILYTDCAMTIVADPQPLLSIAHLHPVCLFQTKGNRQSHWTKRDCFVDMDADNERFWSLPQLTAGFQLYRAGHRARSFVSSLCRAMVREIRINDDPNVLGYPNLPGFMEHRHDQSILTIIAEKLGATLFADPSQYGPWDDERIDSPFSQTFHIHRMVNQRPLKFLKNRLNRVYTGGRAFI